MGMEASPHATAACLEALRDTGLRADLAKIKVPTAIFHALGDGGIRKNFWQRV
jgi:hypothetical protein